MTTTAPPHATRSTRDRSKRATRLPQFEYPTAAGYLVGALRLPAKAFAASSGTEVVVDLPVLRRRPPGVRPDGPAWTETVPVDISDLPPDVEDTLQANSPLVVNEHLADRDHAVLGRLAVGRGCTGSRS
jgi:hypothetical protein